MDRTLTDAIKQHVYALLSEDYLTHIEKTPISKYERKTISKRILEHIEKAQTVRELFELFDYLTQKYPFFRPSIHTLRTEYFKAEKNYLLQKLDTDMKSAEA